MECDECANKDTLYCQMCENKDMFRTQEQKDYENYLCDLMCGIPEED